MHYGKIGFKNNKYNIQYSLYIIYFIYVNNLEVCKVKIN